MSVCEHNTTIELFQHNEIDVGICTWGCGQLLVSVLGENGVTKTFSVSELSALQKRAARADALFYEFQNNPNIELGEVGHKKIEDYFNGVE